MSVVVPRLLGAARQRVPRWFGFVRITYVRTAAAAVFGLTAATGINLSISNHSHRTVSYIVWYGVAALALTVALVVTIVIDHRLASTPPSPSEQTPQAAPNTNMNRWLRQRWLEFKGARAARSLTSECLAQAEAIKAFSRQRREVEPQNDAEARTAWWQETGRLFQERFAAETRRLLEKARDQGAVDFDQSKFELFRLGRANPSEIDELAQLLYNVARGQYEQRSDAPPLSQADRDRIPQETEQRVAQSIHDPALRSLDESNKKHGAEEVDAMTAKAGQQEAERLATLYHESKQLQKSLSIGRIAVLAGAINGTSEPTQIELEQRVRAWDMRVEILLSAGERQRWAQSAALPPYHPTRSLIEPSISIEGLIRFVEQKRACLKEIIERMGDDK